MGILLSFVLLHLGAQTDWPMTRAERTNYTETSHYDDVIQSNDSGYAIYLWAGIVKANLGWKHGWPHLVGQGLADAHARALPFVKDGRAAWTGVRNFQARNNLRAMRKGDLVFFYHSVIGKEVLGIARVAKEALTPPYVGSASSEK